MNNQFFFPPPRWPACRQTGPNRFLVPDDARRHVLKPVGSGRILPGGARRGRQALLGAVGNLRCRRRAVGASFGGSSGLRD